MLAWMNQDAFEETVRTRRACYYSRSRKRLWRKGEESGNVQDVESIYVDCDADTVLLKVRQRGGAACHEGYKSCFFRQLDGDQTRASSASASSIPRGLWQVVRFASIRPPVPKNRSRVRGRASELNRSHTSRDVREHAQARPTLRQPAAGHPGTFRQGWICHQPDFAELLSADRRPRDYLHALRAGNRTLCGRRRTGLRADRS